MILKSSFFKLWVQQFCLLGMIFIPFNFHLFPFQHKVTHFIFGNVVELLSPRLFSVAKYPDVSSDTASLYSLMVILFVMAFGLASLSRYFSRTRRWAGILFKKTLPLYVGIVLFKYGLDKLFLQQFYSPEPNVLYTPLGLLDKDIAYWSIVGASPLYSVFIGLSEILTATMLFFRKSRLLGFFLALLLLTNIVAVNFGFDISVKAFSFFLLLLTVMGLFNYKEEIQQFAHILFSTGKDFVFLDRRLVTRIMAILCTMLVVFEVAKSVELNIASVSNKQSKAYGVVSDCELESEALRIKRIFYHKDGYIILQNHSDECFSYKIQNNQLSPTIQGMDVHGQMINFTFRDDEFPELEFDFQGATYCLKLERLNLEELPLNQDELHWTIDEI